MFQGSQGAHQNQVTIKRFLLGLVSQLSICNGVFELPGCIPQTITRCSIDRRRREGGWGSACARGGAGDADIRVEALAGSGGRAGTDLRLVCKLLAQQFVGGLEEAHVGFGKEVVALGHQRIVHRFRVAQQGKVDKRQKIRSVRTRPPAGGGNRQGAGVQRMC